MVYDIEERLNSRHKIEKYKPTYKKVIIMDSKKTNEIKWIII